MKFFYVLLLASALASGCARAHAKMPSDAPPLDMPAPPPRDVEPNETEAPAPVPLVTEPARNAPARPRPAPPREQPRPDPPKVEPPKPEPPPSEPPKPASEESTRPPTTLQTTPTGEEGDLERGIFATIARANADLSHVDYRTLTTEGRAQYDQAKRFIRQAEDAVRARNLVFAKTLAEKAGALAAQLAGR
jgi:outer membrane biosynthesis protein TonB